MRVFASPSMGRLDARTRPRFVAASMALALSLVVVLGIDAQASSVITRGSRAQPWVALTFDDGWSASRCEAIVRTLRAKRAPATFFINGAIINRERSRWRKMLEGFSIANHTLTHPWLTRLNTAQIRSQIVTNEQVIERVLGRPMLRLLRPPYGAYDSRVVSIAHSLGYRTILWDTSGGDTTSGATTSSVIQNGSRGGKGAIVLLHCGPAATPGAVGPIIDSYRSRGYRLVDLGQMLGFAPAPPPPPDTCRVKNLDTGVTKANLSQAVRAASSGDRLTVRGTCRGVTAVGKDLRIRGTRTGTSGPPTLDGKGQGSVLTVRRGVTVTIRGLRIRGGSNSEGGGIRNAGTLTLRDVIVRGNAARHGGGAYNDRRALLRMQGSSWVGGNNAMRDGGGIWNGGTLTMHASSSLRSNSAKRAGGAWNARSGILTMNAASLIHGNTAIRNGGGVWNVGTLVMQDSSSIHGNTATKFGGGGIYHHGGALSGTVCTPEVAANVYGNTPDDCLVHVMP
jgi:peptidoglycan-N-acetylglucosamine deacetylase